MRPFPSVGGLGQVSRLLKYIYIYRIYTLSGNVYIMSIYTDIDHHGDV